MASDRTVFDQETFQNLQFIKAFGMIDRVTEKFHKIQQETVDLSLKQNRFQQSMTIATSLVGQAVATPATDLRLPALAGEISYGTMTMFVSMAGSLRGSFSGILGLMPMVIRAGISAERIMEITSLPRDSMEDKEEADAIREESHISGVYVRMEDVDFAYEEEKWIYGTLPSGRSRGDRGPHRAFRPGQDHDPEPDSRTLSSAERNGPGGESWRKGTAGFLFHPVQCSAIFPREIPCFRHYCG